MAELIILSPIAKVIIERLGSATVKKVGSLYGVKNDLKKLKNTLSTIEAVLVDAEKQQSHNNQVRLWLQRLEDVVYEADDLVDEVNTEGLQQQLMSGNKVVKEVRKFFSSSNHVAFRNKIAKELKEVRKKMDAIAADRRDFNFVEFREEIARPVRIRRETHSFVAEEDVVGRGSAKRQVLDFLLNPGAEKVSVISIVGMGGLGKTTLAQLVFNDEGVNSHFGLKTWVCVPEDFDLKSLVAMIVEQSGKDDTMELLQKTLREKMNGKRYLLVLDDVWNVNSLKWQDFMSLLSNFGESGSRIIVTTRNELVAKLAGNNQPCHLGFLGEEDSWSLFEKIAFKQGQQLTEANDVEIGKKIVKKCGGVPLAVKMIAGMLSYKDPKTEWSSFLEKELSSILQEENGILPTLKLSYDFLPPHLKRCYAYCRLFPKDYVIDVEKLINRWIAQGFIGASSDGSQSLEEVGYDHFVELFWRSFFQEAKTDKATTKVVKCKMHDLVHDLAIQVAGEKYASLDHGKQRSISEKVFHVSYGLREDVPSSLLQAKRLRSFFLQPYSMHIAKGKLIGEVASNFRFLRMLDLHRSSLDEVPISIGELKHLRYLDLSDNNMITRLPTSITKLVNLQTLILTGCNLLYELPSGIGKLVNLRHVTWSNVCPILPRVGQLTNLQTLSYIVGDDKPNSSKLEELMGLNQLRKLKIGGIRSGMETKEANLNEKLHLRSLKLQWNYLNADDELMDKDKTLEDLQPHQNLRELAVFRYDGVKFPNWLSSLTNLVELKLGGSLKLKQISLPGSLRFLKVMSLIGCTEIEYVIMDENNDGHLKASSVTPVFPSLQKLILVSLPNFKGWKMKNLIEDEDQVIQFPSYFPLLAWLNIKDCPKLTSMPLYPNVKSLLFSQANKKPFEQTASMNMARYQISTAKTSAESSSTSTSTSTSNFFPLSQIKSLHLRCGIGADLQHFPDWMRGLSLEGLTVCAYEGPPIIEPLVVSFCEQRLILDAEEGEERGTPMKGRHGTWEVFSGIYHLALEGVPVLKYLSLAAQYLTLLETLEIKKNEEIDLCSGGDDTAVKWESFTSLQTLSFVSLPKLVALPEWICRFSLLDRLYIEGCMALQSLPVSLSSLTSLQTLEIKECPVLSLETSNNIDSGIKWEALTSLHTLVLDELPNLVALPEGLQVATTLQCLRLCGCDNLTAIPDWICKLSSLRELEIILCPEITSLPESIRSLNSMQTLKIYGCPFLVKRCQEPTGEDWPNIQHIPDLSIAGVHAHDIFSDRLLAILRPLI